MQKELKNYLLFIVWLQSYGRLEAQNPPSAPKTNKSSSYKDKRFIAAISGAAVLLSCMYYLSSQFKKSNRKQNDVLSNKNNKEKIHSKQEPITNQKEDDKKDDNKDISLELGKNSPTNNFDIEKFLSDLISIREPHKFVEIIINDPILALNICTVAHNKVAKIINRIKTTDTLLDVNRKWVELTTSKIKDYFPLFMITECRHQLCSLTRKTHESPRTKFENQLAGLILNNVHSSTQDSYAIVDFGSGNLFPLIRILSLIFTKNPRLISWYIHCIDIHYNYFADLEDHIAKEKRKKGGMFNYDIAYNSFIKEKFKNSTEKELQSTITVKEAENTFLSKSKGVCLIKQQIEYFLKLNFPDILINIFFHKSGDNYLQYVADNCIPRPDMIYACDLLDNTNDLKPMQAFEKFYLETKNINQDVKIISLCKH